MKTISMPLEEFQKEMNQVENVAHQQAYQKGFREGQKNYLKVISQIVLQESINNCTIMWNGMNPVEKKVLEKLITTFVLKSDSEPEKPENKP